MRDRMVPRLPNGVRTLAALLIPAALSFPALADEARDARGEAVYRTHCAECHSGSVMRAPSFATLRQLSAAAIKAALTSGTMSTQGHALSPAEIDAVSRFLGSNLVATANAVTECAETRPVPADAFADPYWNGWGGDATQHRFQPAAMAELAEEDVPKLKLAWAFELRRRQPRLCAADHRRRPPFRRQRQRQGLFAGRQDGLPHLDLRGRRTRSALRSVSASTPAAGPPISEIGGRTPMPSTRSAASCAGKCKLTSILRQRSRGPPRSSTRCFMCLSPLTKKGLVPMLHYPCCSFRGSIAALDTAHRQGAVEEL